MDLFGFILFETLCLGWIGHSLGFLSVLCQHHLWGMAEDAVGGGPRVRRGSLARPAGVPELRSCPCYLSKGRMVKMAHTGTSDPRETSSSFLPIWQMLSG